MTMRHRLRAIGIFPLILLALAITIQLLNPNFATATNLTNITRQVSILAMVAFGMTFVILGGGVDLSVGSVMGLASVLGATLMKSSGSVTAGILIAIAAGAAVGALSGVLIARTGIHPFIVTLGMATVIKGIAFSYTDMQIAGLPSRFLNLASGYIGPLPLLTYIALATFLVCWAILRYTRFGRLTYAIGGREDAAHVAGVNVERHRIAIFALSGAFSAAAGLLLTSRVIAGQASLGQGYELQAIASVIMGGSRMGGGKGGIGGTLMGILLIGVIANGLNLLKVSTFWQEVALGTAIVAAVVTEDLRQRRIAVAAR